MNPELTIQQVTEITEVSTHTLRYYERIGLILNVGRAPNGHRRYNENDIEWITFLKQLKVTRMPLAQMKKFAKLRKKGISTSKQRREMLEVHRKTVVQQIQMLNDCLAMIDQKIDKHRINELTLNPKGELHEQ